MNKIALTMIVAGTEKPKTVKRAIDSAKDYVDGVFVTITTKVPDKKLENMLEEEAVNYTYKPKSFKYELTKDDIKKLEKNLKHEPMAEAGDEVFLFDKARNYNLESVPDEYEWILWIDADDILRGGENLRRTTQVAEANKVDACYFNYIYRAEMENGKIKNILIEHLRERLLRNGMYKWEAPIHETLIEKKPTKKADFEGIDVLHLSGAKRMKKALFRNIKTLEYNLLLTKMEDPRPIYYLGKAYWDLWADTGKDEHLDIAEHLFLAYVQGTEEHKGRNQSGWAEERCQCWEYLVEVFRARKQYNKAIKANLNALAEDERFPSTYINMALNYVFKEEWKRALFWVKLAGKIDQPGTTLVKNPKDLAVRSMEAIYHSALNTAKIKEAWAAAVKLVELCPEDEEYQRRLKFVQGLRKESELTKEFVGIVKHLRKTGQDGKARAIIRGVPDEIENNPIISGVRNSLIPPKEWRENEITIYCGPGVHTWSPKSLERDDKNEFIGGSEEAVIYLTKELSKLGWKVTVYADPGVEEGLHGDVMWKPYFKFNPDDKFNVMVSWRMPNFFEHEIEAEKKYLWCHDVLNPLDFTDELLENFDKAIMLSKAHRETAPSIPEDQVFYSTNGYFEHYPDIEPDNNPKTCIWTSSYDRGLQNLLDMWPEVREEVPDAELHIFYGWKLFKRVYKDNPERMQWMKKMEQKMEQPGITHHGRVIQGEIEKWYKKSGIWAYPTGFYEISCSPAGTFVETEEGDKLIEKLNMTDCVRTSDGTYRPITAIRSRIHDGDIYKITPQCGEPFMVTEEHPLLTIPSIKWNTSRKFSSLIKRDAKWVLAKDLKKHDILLSSINVEADTFDIDIEPYKASRKNHFKNSKNKLDTKLDEEKLWWFGYFAGDGNANNQGKVSCLVADSHREEHLAKVVDGFKSWGLPVKKRKQQGCIEVYGHSYQLCRYLRDNFYDDKRKKVLPKDLLIYEPVLDGLIQADGTINDNYNNGKGTQYTFTNTSRKLISQVRIMINRVGLTGKIRTREHKNGSISYSINWTTYKNRTQNFYESDGDYLYYKIRDIEKLEYDDLVYNIDVDVNHDYHTNGIITHNCISAMKAMLWGAVPVTMDYAALKETVQHGIKIDGDIYDYEAKQEYKKALIKALKDEDWQEKERKKMMPWARKEYSWTTVAESWDKEFKKEVEHEKAD